MIEAQQWLNLREALTPRAHFELPVAELYQGNRIEQQHKNDLHTCPGCQSRTVPVGWRRAVSVRTCPTCCGRCQLNWLPTRPLIVLLLLLPFMS